jgi:hypothetical protein
VAGYSLLEAVGVAGGQGPGIRASMAAESTPCGVVAFDSELDVFFDQVGVYRDRRRGPGAR